MQSPRIEFTDQLNAVSAQIEAIDRQLARKWGYIQLIDEQMRERFAIVADLAFTRIEILQEQTNFSKGDGPRLIQRFADEIERFRDDYTVNLEALLGARDAIIEGDVQLSLTDERKDAIRNRYFERLDSEIRCAEEENSHMVNQLELGLITKEVALGVLKGIHTAYEGVFCDFMEEKTEVTRDAYAMQEQVRPEIIALRAERAKLLSAARVTDIYIACQLPSLCFVKDLADSGGLRKLVNVRNAQGFLPIDVAAMAGSYYELRLLLEAGSKANAKNDLGYEAIHWAAKSGASGCVRALLKAGASVKARGEFKRTPLHMAVFNGHREATQLLIAHGADVNARAEYGKAPLHDAVIHGDIDVVRALLEGSNVEVLARDERGYCPIRDAVMDGQVEILKLLMQHRSFFEPGKEEKIQGENDPSSIEMLLKLVPSKREGEVNAVLRWARGALQEFQTKSEIREEIRKEIEEDVRCFEAAEKKRMDIGMFSSSSKKAELAEKVKAHKAKHLLQLEPHVETLFASRKSAEDVESKMEEIAL